MKLTIKNKFFTIGGDSKVLDEQEKEIYKVKGKPFSITKKKRICDLEGNVLFVVRNKYWTFMKKTCIIYNADEEEVLRVYRGDWQLANRYNVEGYKDEMQILGKYFRLGYDVLVNNEKKARIERVWKFFALGDTFTLETQDQQNIPLYIALTIAIDNISDKKSKQST